MKKFKTILLYLFALLISACSTSNNKPDKHLNNYSPVSKSLYDSIFHMDSALFNAFNTRNMDKLKIFFSEDLEFYHDLGGVTNFQQNLDAFKKTFESDRRVRRELVTGSLEVYPIKGFGAVETGIHRFYVIEEGKEEKLGSEAKFVHLWQKKESEWKITRVISYGHHEY